MASRHGSVSSLSSTSVSALAASTDRSGDSRITHDRLHQPGSSFLTEETSSIRGRGRSSDGSASNRSSSAGDSVVLESSSLTDFVLSGSDGLLDPQLAKEQAEAERRHREKINELRLRQTCSPYELSLAATRHEHKTQLVEVLERRAAHRERCYRSLSRLTSVMQVAEEHGRHHSDARTLSLSKKSLWEESANEFADSLHHINGICALWAHFLDWSEESRFPTQSRLLDCCIALRRRLVATRCAVDSNLLLWVMDNCGEDLMMGNREGFKFMQFLRRECRMHEWLWLGELERRGWKVPADLKQRKRQLRQDYAVFVRQQEEEFLKQQAELERIRRESPPVLLHEHFYRQPGASKHHPTHA